jgi:hypothetical protein
MSAGDEALREAETWSGKSDEQILLAIAEAVAPPGIMPKSVSGKIRDALAWLSGNAEDLRKAVCGHSVVASLASDDDKSGRRLTLVCAVADAIATLKLSTPPFAVAVLLVREGILSMCEEQWKLP